MQSQTKSVMGNPNWQKGVSGNPNGRGKGVVSQKTAQWNALHDSIVNEHTLTFNQCMKDLSKSDPIIFMRMYLEVLNYFKPRLSSTDSRNINVAAQGIVLNITPDQVPSFPDNFNEDSIPFEEVE